MCLVLLQLTFTVLNAILNGFSREDISERHIDPVKRQMNSINPGIKPSVHYFLIKAREEVFNINIKINVKIKNEIELECS